MSNASKISPSSSKILSNNKWEKILGCPKQSGLPSVMEKRQVSPGTNAKVDKKQEYQDNTDRIEVERAFSLGKHCYGTDWTDARDAICKYLLNQQTLSKNRAFY